VYRFRLLDQLSSKSPDAAANEDAVAATIDTAWVIDGATGVSDDPPLTAAETDAAWLASWLNGALLAGFRTSETSISEVFSQLETNLLHTFSALAGAPQTTAATQPAAALSLIGIRDTELICMGIGDCTVLLESHAGDVSCFNVSEIREPEAQLIRERQRLLNLHPGEDPWPRLRGQIRRFRDNVNQPGGYSAIHPTRPWASLVREQKLRLEGVSHALLVTDGLYRLVDVFRAYDDSGFIHKAQSHGLRHLMEQLRDLEGADHSCHTFPRVKPTDDASGVLLLIER
jgi:hypothetical protein